MSAKAVAIAALTAAVVGATNVPADSELPYWAGPRLHLAHILTGEPFGGAKTVDNTTYTKIYHATPEVGTYNHAAMITYFDGQFLVTWKNSPVDEDQVLVLNAHFSCLIFAPG